MADESVQSPKPSLALNILNYMLVSWNGERQNGCMEILEPALVQLHPVCREEMSTCMVKSAAAIAWRTNTTLRMDFALSASDDDAELYYSEEGGFQVTTRQEGGTDVGLSNFTSSLHVRDLYYLQYLL